jgi:hypothetical protein
MITMKEQKLGGGFRLKPPWHEGKNIDIIISEHRWKSK